MDKYLFYYQLTTTIKLVRLMRIVALILTLLLALFWVKPAFASSVAINEIYYDVDSTHGVESDNEWIELYNATDNDIDLVNWTITDNNSTKTLPAIIIKKKNTLVIASKSTTWNFWTISSDKITLESKIGNGLGNDGDRLLLKNSSNEEEDKLSYGNDTTYSSIVDVDEGHSLERVPAGSSFIDQSTPTPGIINTTSPSPSPGPSSASSPSPSTSTTASTSFIISNNPNVINFDEPFKVAVNLTMPNNANTVYYLKGAFKQVDATRYLGLTKVNSDWIEYGDDSSSQYKITTDSSGNWSGEIEVMPDSDDKDYKGSGDYVFKVGRYTSGGSGPTWSNDFTLTIKEPVVEIAEEVEASSSSQSSILKAEQLGQNDATIDGEVLSVNKISLTSLSPTPSPENESSGQTNSNIFSKKLFSIAGGIILIGSSLGLYLRTKNNHLK